VAGANLWRGRPVHVHFVLRRRRRIVSGQPRPVCCGAPKIDTGARRASPAAEELRRRRRGGGHASAPECESLGWGCRAIGLVRVVRPCRRRRRRRVLGTIAALVQLLVVVLRRAARGLGRGRIRPARRILLSGAPACRDAGISGRSFGGLCSQILFPVQCFGIGLVAC
jgi:hypothetical protein